MIVKTVFLCDVSTRCKEYLSFQKHGYCDVTLSVSYSVTSPSSTFCNFKHILLRIEISHRKMGLTIITLILINFEYYEIVKIATSNILNVACSFCFFFA